MTETLMHYREQAATALYPFMAAGVDWNEDMAMAAAYQAIDCYGPQTPREVQLSAQIVACSFAAIACLRSAVAGKDLSATAILKLQDTALALDEQAHKATKALEAKQRERQRAPQALTEQSVAWDDTSFRRTLSSALKKMQEADAKIADLLPKRKPMPPKLQVVASAPMTTAVLAELAQAARTGAKGRPKEPIFRLV